MFKQIDVSHYMIDEDTLNLVVPGDLITSEEGFMKYGLSYSVGTALIESVMTFTPR